MRRKQVITEAGWTERLFRDHYDNEEEEEEDPEVEYDDDHHLRLFETGKALVNFDGKNWTFFDVNGKPFEVDPDDARAIARYLVEND